LALDVAVTSQGNLIVAGFFEDSVNFGDGPRNAAGGRDAFVGRYNAAGDLRWAKTFGGPGNDQADALAVDQDGNIHVSDHFAQQIDFGAGPVNSSGDDDAYVISVDSAGALRWAVTFGGMGQDRATDLALDGNGNLVVVGRFEGKVSFGDMELDSGQAPAGFVVRIAPGL
jgi:hypothetical protein